MAEGHAERLQRVRIVLGKLCWVFRFDAPFALFAISFDDKVDIVNLANFFLVFPPLPLPLPLPLLIFSLPLLTSSPLGGECFDCVGCPLDFSRRFDCIMYGANYKQLGEASSMQIEGGTGKSFYFY